MASSARGQANHCLYLARILIAAWRRDSEAQNLPASILAQAFLPGVQSQLRLAYGWFLLEITRQEPLPEKPPACCDELPPRPEGKVLPGEIAECRQLEQQGWLAELLAPPAQPTAGRSPDNLASGPAPGSPEQAAAWADSLQRMFDRMGDSLDEY